MKSSFKFISIFAIAAIITDASASCSGKETPAGTKTLSGNITVSPPAATTGTELTATYSGSETVSYQWKKAAANVGTNTNRYTPIEAGSYTVTVNAAGYAGKISSAVEVTGSTSDPSDAVIYAKQTKQQITEMGFDIKQPGKADAMTDAIIKRLYTEDGMTLLRIPYYGQIGSSGPGQFSDNGIQLYAKANRVINMVLKYKSDVKLFASIRMADNINDGGTCTFPDWVLVNNGATRPATDKKGGTYVLPEKYAILIYDYLNYMNGLGYKIYALGVDNESNIPGAVQNQTIVELKKLLTRAGLPIPLIVAPEEDKPTPDVLQAIFDAPDGVGNVDMVASHNYCTMRRQQFNNYADLGKMATDHGKPFWQSEQHWGETSQWLPNFSNSLNRADGGLSLLFDFIDNGGSVISWWSYSNSLIGTNSDIKHKIQPLLNKNLLYSYPLTMTPYTQNVVPGTQNGATENHGYEKFNIRSFRKDNNIIIWLLNNTDVPLPGYCIRIDGETIGGNVSFVSWGASNNEISGTAKKVSDSKMEIDVAARRIYMITISGVYGN